MRYWPWWVVENLLIPHLKGPNIVNPVWIWQLIPGCLEIKYSMYNNTGIRDLFYLSNNVLK